jgi:hypothetical protein
VFVQWAGAVRSLFGDIGGTPRCAGRCVTEWGVVVVASAGVGVVAWGACVSACSADASRPNVDDAEPMIIDVFRVIMMRWQLMR